MMVAEETQAVLTWETDAHEVAARLNRTLAQLGWAVSAEIESGSKEPDQLVLRRVASNDEVGPDTTPLRVGHGSLGRPNLIDSVLAELRARGWNRLGERPAPRADVLWCAPA
jgi:hypothetical protein